MALQNIAGRLVDVIFGYDFFVSYTWADGSKYAHSLHEKLKTQGFTVFVDEEDFARGDNWTLLGRRALKKTRQLVLIATPRIHESAPVLKELTAFQWTGRRIIPIEIGDALDPQKYRESPLLRFTPEDLLKIKQPLQEGKIPNEAPPEVVRELRRGFQHVRQAQIRVRVLLGACLVLLGLLSIAVWQAISADLQRKKAVAATKKTSEVASRGNVSLARYSKDSGKNAQALAQLAQALRLNPENREASGLTAAMLTQLSWHVPLTGSIQHDAEVTSAQFSPDGQRVLTASKDKTVRVWDAASGKPIGERMEHGDDVITSAQFSPDGHRVMTVSGDLTAWLWDAANGTPIGEPMQHEGWVNSAKFSPDGRRVVTSSEDGTARLWDAASGKPIGKLMKHEKDVNSAQFSPDGRRVVTSSKDNTARLWDALSGKPLGKLMKHEKDVNSAQFSPDGQRVVTSSWDLTARVWDAANGKPIGEPIKHDERLTSARFSPDGQRVLTASGDQENGTARLCDALIATDKDTREDILLLAELAEATGGETLETVGQADILTVLTPEQIRASWKKIAAKFSGPPLKFTPLQQFLKWSVADRRSRTISPLSQVTVSEWLENRIKDGAIEGLRSALQVDPANARITAHLGRRLADYALKEGGDPVEARRARGEADFLTSRARKLAPDNDEVKKLRDEVIKLLGV